MCRSSFSINEKGFNFSIFCFLLELHTSSPHTLWHASSDPEPNMCLLRHCSTINGGTHLATIVFSSAFGTIACATLKQLI